MKINQRLYQVNRNIIKVSLRSFVNKNICFLDKNIKYDSNNSYLILENKPIESFNKDFGIRPIKGTLNKHYNNIIKIVLLDVGILSFLLTSTIIPCLFIMLFIEYINVDRYIVIDSSRIDKLYLLSDGKTCIAHLDTEKYTFDIKDITNIKQDYESNAITFNVIRNDKKKSFYINIASYIHDFEVFSAIMNNHYVFSNNKIEFYKANKTGKLKYEI